MTFKKNKIDCVRIYKNINGNISDREIQVLELVSYGKTSIEISNELFISVNTVKTHKKNLFEKLNVNNTALLIRKGFEAGYLMPKRSENMHLINNFTAAL